jgi:hypothetical protein
LLLLGAMPLPYGYYNFLRLAVSISSLISGYVAFKKNESVSAVVVVSGIILILFNPVFPVHLTKGVWAFLDIAAAAWFIFVALRGYQTSNLPTARQAGG